jgi:ribonuclease HI
MEIRMNPPCEIFCDGGVVGRNPSIIGGTWAYCWVDKNGERVLKKSGVVTPSDIGLPAVTNNLTELLAVMKGLESVEEGWKGDVYTDSKVTLLRITTSKSFKGIPVSIINNILHLRRTRVYEAILLSGHPTKEHLAKGIGKRGTPVSVHNVWCDEQCQRLAREFLSQQALTKKSK